MQIYLVCEEIDLGYHVHSVYFSKEKAESVVKALTQESLDSNVKGVLEVLPYWPRERAEEHCIKWSLVTKYNVEEVTVE